MISTFDGERRQVPDTYGEGVPQRLDLVIDPRSVIRSRHRLIGALNDHARLL
jgi:hypothetical protein